MKTLNAFLILILIFTGSVFAGSDKKIYSAAAGYVSGQSNSGAWLGNMTSGSKTAYLPVDRDQTLENIKSAWIKVTDANPVQNFSAKLWVNYNNGNTLTTKGYNPTSKPTGSSGAAKYIYFGSLPTHNTNAAYYFTTSIPRASR